MLAEVIIKCLIELPVCDSTAVRTVVVTIVPDPQVLYFQRPRAHRRHAVITQVWHFSAHRMLEGVVASIAALPQMVGGSGAVYVDTLHRG